MPTIRQAEPTDIPELVRLRTRFLAELRHGAGGPDGRASAGDEPSPAELASAALLEESTAAYYGRALPAGQFVGWLAEEAGEVVGMAGVFYFERPPMERPGAVLEGRIVNVYTRPGWRGRGIGTALTRVAVEHARARGARRVRLGTTETARPMYARLGFRPVTRELELPLLTLFDDLPPAG